LSKEEDILDENRLEYNWDVGGVEQLDGKWLSQSFHLSTRQLKFNLEVTEIVNNKDNKDCTDHVHKVWSVFPE